MCIQTVCKEFPEKEQKPIDGKSAYAKWISESGFDQISYNPGAEELWIAGYNYGASLRQQGVITNAEHDK